MYGSSKSMLIQLCRNRDKFSARASATIRISPGRHSRSKPQPFVVTHSLAPSSSPPLASASPQLAVNASSRQPPAVLALIHTHQALMAHPTRSSHPHNRCGDLSRLQIRYVHRYCIRGGAFSLNRKASTRYRRSGRQCKFWRCRCKAKSTVRRGEWSNRLAGRKQADTDFQSIIRSCRRGCARHVALALETTSL